jgi:histidinol-phosphatase (PHP family)
MNYFNLHTHSSFCDGKGDPEEYVLAAMNRGFHTLGFSSHAPVPFKNTFAIKGEEELQAYCAKIRKLQEKYRDRITIFLGLELDYIEGISGDFREIKERCGLDYTIGSVHLVRNGSREGLWFIDGPKVDSYDQGLKDVFSGDIKKAIAAYYEQVNRMILTRQPDILGHFDKIKMHNNDRYFREDEPWYRELVMDLLETIKKSGIIVEVNTRGIYKKRCKDLYPGLWILRIMKESKIPVTISTDAHHPSEIDGYYDETIQILKQEGFRSLVCLNTGRWEEVPVTSDHRPI